MAKTFKIKIFLITIITILSTSCDYFYFKNLEKLEKAGYYELGIEKYTKLLEIEKNDDKKAWLNYKIAFLYEKNKQYEYAENHYQKAIQLDPSKSNYYISIGRTHLKNNNFEKVVILYKDLIHKNQFPDDSNLLMLFLGRAYLDLNLFPEAQKIFSEIRGNKSTNNGLKAQAYYFSGLIKLKIGSEDSAMGYIKTAITLDPNNPDPYISIGTHLAQKGNLSDAKKYFEKSIILNTDKPEPFHNLGNLYSIENNIEKAVEYYSKALKLDDNLLETHFRLALIYIDKKKFEFARYHLNKIKNTQPEFVNVDKYFGKIFLLESNYSKSVEHLEKGLNLTNTDGEIYYWLSIAYGNIENFEKSLNTLLKLESINKNHDNLYTKIADVYLILNQTENAKNYYNKELKRTPKNPNALVGLAKIETKEKRKNMKKIKNLLTLAIKNGYEDIEGLKNSPYFTNLKQYAEIKMILQK